MIFISHRGNISGAEPENENRPEYIKEALSQGYEVELDLWWGDEIGQMGFYLGHDRPTYPVHPDFLESPGLWIHCKDGKSLAIMMGRNDHRNLNIFTHNNDPFTVTSKGIIWAYKDLVCNNSILVCPSHPLESYPRGYKGICSDNIQYYRNMFTV